MADRYPSASSPITDDARLGSTGMVAPAGEIGRYVLALVVFLSAIMRDRDKPSPCFVYILGCATQNGYRTYVGWTLDLARRLAQHNSGKGAKSTRGGTWTLLYWEQYATRREAMSREWHLKRDRALRRQVRPT